MVKWKSIEGKKSLAEKIVADMIWPDFLSSVLKEHRCWRGMVHFRVDGNFSSFKEEMPTGPRSRMTIRRPGGLLKK